MTKGQLPTDEPRAHPGVLELACDPLLPPAMARTEAVCRVEIRTAVRQSECVPASLSAEEMALHFACHLKNFFS